mmetsp:Transcript_21836/g.35045  ORF Transcript_21836/g.35045 Transcript_21836/m.35045 type:complete len:97 (+) Transcript_21836:1110-1400(+)
MFIFLSWLCIFLDRPAMRADPYHTIMLLAMIEANQIRHVVEKNSIQSSELDDTNTDCTSLRRQARSWNGTRSKHRDLALRNCASRQRSLNRSVVSG